MATVYVDVESGQAAQKVKCLSKYTTLSCVVIITRLCVLVEYIRQSCVVGATRPLIIRKIYNLEKRLGKHQNTRKIFLYNIHINVICFNTFLWCDILMF